MFAIFKREMRSYLTSPLGYVFIGVFLAANGLLFSYCTLEAGSDSSVGSYFTMLMFVFIILIPLLTMKSLSEERKLRTEQLYLTSPVSLGGIVAGKFFSAYAMFALTFLLGCTNFYTLYKFGDPNTARIFGYCIATLLIGAAFIAVGIFISSLTENQLIAAIGTIAALGLFLAIGLASSYIPYEWLRVALNWLSIYTRFSNFTFGIFDFASVLYYASICFVFLFLTVRVYERRRWA